MIFVCVSRTVCMVVSSWKSKVIIFIHCCITGRQVKQLFYQLLYFNKNTEGKAISMFHRLAISDFLLHMHTYTYTLTVFNPLTLLFTLLNPHIHLSFLHLFPFKLLNCPPSLPPCSLSFSLFLVTLLVRFICHVIFSLIPLLSRFLSTSTEFLDAGSHFYLLNMRGSNI